MSCSNQYLGHLGHDKISTMVTYLAPLVALVGALLYGFAGNPKAQQLGLIAFLCGLLATLLKLDASSFRLHVYTRTESSHQRRRPPARPRPGYRTG